MGYFIWRVWKEIERDGELYRNTAAKLAGFSAASWDLLGRWGDAVSGWFFSVFARRYFTQQYLRELPQLRSLVDVRGLVQMESNHLELEEVYVELKAASRAAGKRSCANPISHELKERAPIWDHLRFLKPGAGLAMIGAPGCGKTTLLKHLMLTYAENRQWRHRVRRRVPFFIELRKLPKLLDKKNPNLPTLLKTVLEADDDLKALLPGMPNDWLATLLKKGQCLLLWDGLDEVPDATTRQKVSGWLDKQINHTEWRGNLCIVTARPTGYESAPLKNVIELEVQPFDWVDTRHFIHRWYLANRLIKSRATTTPRKVRKLAALDADKLLRRLRDHPRLGAFTSNPLLLTMVCLMHELGELPGSRSQLYEEICQVHLERWRRRKEVNDGGPEPKESWNAAQKLMVLRPLAHHLMNLGVNGKNTDSKRLYTDEMFKVAKQALDHIGVAKDNDSRKLFFNDLHQHSGLWLEWERDQWGFAHLSFQEYLCADLWFVEPSSAPTDWTPLFEQSWWQEVLLLYASKTTDLRPVVQAALDSKTPHSLAFLFALELETVTIPTEHKVRIDTELYHCLAAKTEELFQPAGEAWLLRQQAIGYARLTDQSEMSDWVTQAEYQLFLNDTKKENFRPLHTCEEWFQGDPRQPALGMSYYAAVCYCHWLDQKFTEFQHRLAVDDEVGWLQQDSDAVTWIASMRLSPFSASLASKQRGINLAEFHAINLYGAYYSAQKLAVARKLARDPAGEFNLFHIAHEDIRVAQKDLSDSQVAQSWSLYHSRILQYAIVLDKALSRSINLTYSHDHDRATERTRMLAKSIAIALDRSFDFDQKLDHNSKLFRELYNHKPLTRAVARAVLSDYKDFVAHYSEKMLELRSGQEIKRSLVGAENLASGLNHCLSINSDIILMKREFRVGENHAWLKMKQRALEQVARRGSIESQRLYVFFPLFDLWSPEMTIHAVPSVYRQFILNCIEVIRESGTASIDTSILQLESFTGLLVNREKGKAVPCEGIRVVRTRRQ